MCSELCRRLLASFLWDHGARVRTESGEHRGKARSSHTADVVMMSPPRPAQREPESGVGVLGVSISATSESAVWVSVVCYVSERPCRLSLGPRSPCRTRLSEHDDTTRMINYLCR